MRRPLRAVLRHADGTATPSPGWQPGVLSHTVRTWPWSGRNLAGRRIAAGVALTTAVALGALIAISPIVLAVASVVAVATLAIPSAAGRFAIVVVGGLFVMGSSSQIDDPKVAYLAWVAASIALALATLSSQGEDRNGAARRRLLLASAAASGAVALALVVAFASETPIVDSIRDGAPYGLLAVAPLLALDGARSRLGTHMELLIVAVGLVASAAFAVEFAGRRGIVDLPFASLALPSTLLAALAFAVSCAAILSRRPHRILWAAVATALLTLMLITGTRSTLVLLAAPVAMVFTQGGRARRALRLLGATIVVSAAVLTLGFMAAQSSLVDVARLTERFTSLMLLGSNLTADPSYIERATQLGLAWSTFLGSPAVGVGLGFKFEVLRFGGQTVPAFTLDTSLAVAAKFGVIGLGLLGAATLAMISFYRRLRDRLPEHVRLSSVGFTAVAVALLPLGNPIEDKGFGFALAMLLAWALASASTAAIEANAVAGIGAATPNGPRI